MGCDDQAAARPPLQIHGGTHRRLHPVIGKRTDRAPPILIDLGDAQAVIDDGPATDAGTDGKAMLLLIDLGREADGRHHDHEFRIGFVDQPQGNHICVAEQLGYSRRDGIENILQCARDEILRWIPDSRSIRA